MWECAFMLVGCRRGTWNRKNDNQQHPIYSVVLGPLSTSTLKRARVYQVPLASRQGRCTFVTLLQKVAQNSRNCRKALSRTLWRRQTAVKEVDSANGSLPVAARRTALAVETHTTPERHASSTSQRGVHDVVARWGLHESFGGGDPNVSVGRDDPLWAATRREEGATERTHGSDAQ
ncbi:hypothetical protein IF2G_04722 [Cordyceps javanica]|nr:hypothetical protein IF2G_04722 [Cordyceps javanica]